MIDVPEGITQNIYKSRDFLLELHKIRLLQMNMENRKFVRCMMVKRVLVKLTASYFFFSSFSPLSCANVRHDPRELLQLSFGQYAVSPPIITKASNLHSRGITGRGIKIAVIDRWIHPSNIAALDKKGCILPSAIQKKLVLTPHEKLEQLRLAQLLSDPLKFNTSAAYRESYYRKGYFDYFNSEINKIDHHGSMVMQTLHTIAPKSQLLPVDIGAIACRELAKQRPDQLPPEGNNYFTAAVREAINSNVDAISLSIYPAADFLSANYTNVLKEAAQKGIAIIVAAGNDSAKEKAVFLGNRKNPTTSISRKCETKNAFEGLRGKNMLFCGSLGYKEKGEETFSEFSQHPAQDALTRYVLAPGEKILIQKNNQQFLASGTSLSAPITAGSFALLKQYVKDKKLAHTNDDLLRTLYNSGHSLTHNIPGTPFKTYKSLNLQNAVKAVDLLAKQPNLLPSAKTAVMQPPKKQVAAAPKRTATKKRTLIQTTRRNAVIAKRRVAARGIRLQAARRNAIVAKRRIATKRALLQAARKAAIDRKRRAVGFRKS